MNAQEAAQYLADSNSGKVTWDDNARNQANAALSGGGGGGGMSFADAAKQMMDMYREAAKPAIESLQASIPETQAKYTQQKTQLQAEQKPLEERYQNLLNEVTRREGVAVGAAELQQSKELGARGIVPSSGLYSKSTLEATQPIRAEYTTIYKDTALERESALRNLSNLIQNVDTASIEGVRAIQNAIAQLQAGAGAQGVTGGMNLYQSEQQKAYNNQLLAIQQAADARAAELQNYNLSVAKQTDPIDVALKQIALKNANQPSTGSIFNDTDYYTSQGQVFGNNTTSFTGWQNSPSGWVKIGR